jgi:GABA(A) receptor-associated protein
MNSVTSYSSTNNLPTYSSESDLTTMNVKIVESVEQNVPVTPISNEYLERVKKSQIILEKYPDRVPLIIQPSKNDKDSFPIDKSKYITPRDLTLMQLQQIIRKRVRFPAEKALFIFINNKIYPITSLVGAIYDTNKDADGFLYITYCQESTFGRPFDDE